jgi:hypothetical protein
MAGLGDEPQRQYQAVPAGGTAQQCGEACALLMSVEFPTISGGSALAAMRSFAFRGGLCLSPGMLRRAAACAPGRCRTRQGGKCRPVPRPATARHRPAVPAPCARPSPLSLRRSASREGWRGCGPLHPALSCPQRHCSPSSLPHTVFTLPGRFPPAPSCAKTASPILCENERGLVLVRFDCASYRDTDFHCYSPCELFATRTFCWAMGKEAPQVN